MRIQGSSGQPHLDEQAGAFGAALGPPGPSGVRVDPPDGFAAAGTPEERPSGMFGRFASRFLAIVTDAVDTVLGCVRTIAGVLASPSRMPGEFAAGLSGLVLLVAGRALSAVQRLIGLEPEGRPLTVHEVGALGRIFGEAIDLRRVRIAEGDAGLFSAVSNRAFVHGNVIYTKARTPTFELLAHELVHVWQYQHGGADYLTEALAAEPLGDGYDWQKAVSEGTTFCRMNPEQQAALIGAAASAGFFSGDAGERERSFEYQGKDYSSVLRAALAELRAGRGAP